MLSIDYKSLSPRAHSHTDASHRWSNLHRVIDGVICTACAVRIAQLAESLHAITCAVTQIEVHLLDKEFNHESSLSSPQDLRLAPPQPLDILALE